VRRILAGFSIFALANDTVPFHLAEPIKGYDMNMGPGETLSLAARHHQTGNLREAEVLYRQILQAQPGHVDALHMLGIVAHQVGKNDLAVTYIQQAIRLYPEFPAAYSNLGIALRELGKVEEAISSYRQALRLKPDYAEAYYNLGNALFHQGKVEEAIASYREALRLKPNYSDAHNNLGNALKDHGRLDEAITSYRRAIHLNPNNGETHNNLGNALKDQGKLDEAITCFRQVLRLNPNDADALNNLGNALTDQGKLEEAITSYRQAMRLRPNHADAHANMGFRLVELGRNDEAVASFQEALRLQPKHAEALCQLATLLRGKLPDADLTVLEQRLAESDMKDADRSMILFSLAEECDAKGEYARAASLLRQANALSLSLRRRQGRGYQPDENARFVDSLLAAFTPAFFERVRGFGLETERPVFIVGLPRSGTTLTEQILAAHSHAYGAGEINLARMDFLALGAQPTDESVFTTLPGLPGEALHRRANRHFAQLGALNAKAARVVDKMPDNYYYLGLLAALFPRAKFIHCRRDARDVAVSCWMTNFRDYHWANDPKHIATRFRDYQRLMEHWRTVLPVAVLNVQYEETVADLAGQARRLVEWCGLDWEPGCLKFNEGFRPVCTASKVQVRKPVYTRSVGRWRNYEQEMRELFAALQTL
jgi:tetratricopeptide (TPR) repeat protein